MTTIKITVSSVTNSDPEDFFNYIKMILKSASEEMPKISEVAMYCCHCYVCEMHIKKHKQTHISEVKLKNCAICSHAKTKHEDNRYHPKKPVGCTVKSGSGIFNVYCKCPTYMSVLLE